MRNYQFIAIGTSYGGLNAASVILEYLPAPFEPAVAIVQHRSKDSDGTLTRLLQDHCLLPVQEVEDKEPIRGGRVYVAPPDYHLLVEREAFSLSVDAPVLFSRPSIDVFFESVADVFAEHAIGVVLTGANADGAAGLQAIHASGGLTIVQDPATAAGRAMPDAAIAAGQVDAIRTLEEIGRLLRDLGQSGGRAARRISKMESADF